MSDDAAARPFKQRGGARGVTRHGLVVNYTWPFVSIALDDDALRLSVLGKAERYPLADLERLRIVRGWLSRGIAVKPRRRVEFTFWSFDLPALVAALEERGLVVEPEGSA